MWVYVYLSLYVYVYYTIILFRKDNCPKNSLWAQNYSDNHADEYT